MKKFKFSKKELELIENSCVPSAVYQFVDMIDRRNASLIVEVIIVSNTRNNRNVIS